MTEYAWAMLVYFSLQGASLILLPRWWKLAAAPALLLVPPITSEWRQPSYMGDVITAMLAVYACTYLVVVWIMFGIANAIQRFRQNREENDSETHRSRSS